MAGSQPPWLSVTKISFSGPQPMPCGVRRPPATYSIAPVSLLIFRCVPRSLRALRHGRGAAQVDRDRQVQVEEPVLVEQAEGELVEVAVERERRERGLALVDAVAVRVDQLGEPVLLGDVDVAVDDLDAQRLAQALGDLRARHAGGVGGGLDAGELPHLAGLGHAARVAVVVAPGQHEQVVAVPLQAGDLRLEAGRAQVDEVVGGVDAVEREPVAGRVDVALALLGAGSGHAHGAVGAQGRGRDDGEGAVAGLAPAQPQLLTAAGLEEVDPQVVTAGGQLDRAVLVLRAVQAVVVDHERVVDEQLRAVVATKPEGVVAGGRHGQGRDRVHDEVLRQAPERRVAFPVDRRLELVDVRRLARLDHADLARCTAQLEHALRDARVLRRWILRVREGAATPSSAIISTSPFTVVRTRAWRFPADSIRCSPPREIRRRRAIWLRA